LSVGVVTTGAVGVGQLAKIALNVAVADAGAVDVGDAAADGDAAGVDFAYVGHGGNVGPLLLLTPPLNTSETLTASAPMMTVATNATAPHSRAHLLPACVLMS
jgi:hypothetical protein